MRLRPAAFAVLAALTAAPAAAVDTVEVVGEDPVVGKISDVSRDGVTVSRKVSGDETVPANVIQSVEYDGEPAAMKLARTAERNGRTAEAVEQLTDVLKEVGDDKNLAGEVTFLIARAKARAALADASARDDAVKTLEDFRSGFPTHYRFYEGQLWLGKVQAAAGNTGAAKAAFGQLEKSGFTDYEMAAKVAAADAKFTAGDVDGARADYAAVAGMSPKTRGETSRRLAALLGKARVETADGKFDAAIATLDTVITETSAEDTDVQAEAYLRQGDAFAATGSQAKAAVMAYLHVDVIPSLAREQARHAEALYRLSTLWPAVGHADRGAEAAARLRQMYPGSEWTAKLSG